MYSFTCPNVGSSDTTCQKIFFISAKSVCALRNDERHRRSREFSATCCWYLSPFRSRSQLTTPPCATRTVESEPGPARPSRVEQVAAVAHPEPLEAGQPSQTLRLSSSSTFRASAASRFAGSWCGAKRLPTVARLAEISPPRLTATFPKEDDEALRQRAERPWLCFESA